MYPVPSLHSRSESKSSAWLTGIFDIESFILSTPESTFVGNEEDVLEVMETLLAQLKQVFILFM